MKVSCRCLPFILLLLTGLGVGQSAAPVSDTPALLPGSPLPGSPLNAEQVVDRLVQRNLERARLLGAYQGTRVYKLEYRGFPGSRSAEMIVDVKYRSPGTKEFTILSEKGSKLIIDRVFKRMLDSEKEAQTAENQRRVALNPTNYRFALVGYENGPNGPA